MSSSRPVTPVEQDQYPGNVKTKGHQPFTYYRHLVVSHSSGATLLSEGAKMLTKGY